MITDEQLKAAALELDSALMENLPEPGSQEFSPCFERKMKRLLRRKDASRLKGYGLRAAAVLLTVLLLGGIVLISSPDTMAEFKGLFYKVEKEHEYRYVLDGWVEEEDLREYRLGWVPEGYELTNSQYRDNRGMALYNNEQKNRIFFNYIIQSSRDQMTSTHSFSAVDYELEDTIVNGRGADLFVIRDRTGASSYTVLWMNAERSILFSVRGARSEEEAVRMAESIEEYIPEE